MIKIISIIAIVFFTGCTKKANLGNLPGVKGIENVRPENPNAEEFQANLEWDVPSTVFNSTAVNEIKEKTIVLKNTGKGQSNPIQFSWANTDSPFNIKNGFDTCTGIILPSGSSCSVVLRFNPTVNGNKTNILMATDLIKSKALVVSGSGTGGINQSPSPSKIVWMLDDYDFSNTSLTMIKTFDLIASNIGGQNSNPLETSWVNNSSPFTLVSGFNFCENQVLSPGGNCKVRIKFLPVVAGSYLNVLKISDGISNDEIQIAGTGLVIPSQLAFNISSYSFNKVIVGNLKTLDVKLKNNALVASNTISLSWTSTANYSIVSGLDQCSGQILPAGGECSLKIQFAPNQVGLNLSSTLTADDGTSSSSISLTGEGQDFASTIPVAFTKNINAVEDINLNDNLQGTDPSSLPLTFSISTNPTKGTVVITNSSTGAFKYTPNPNASGVDSFTFKVKNSSNVFSTDATVNISITEINDNPVASPDSATTTEDTDTTVTVLSNDTDVENQNLTVVSVSQPTNGTTILNSDNTIKYTPNLNYKGNDSFMYTISDGNGGTASTVVSLIVNSVNDNPISNNNSIILNEDTTINSNLSANDGDNDVLTYSIVSQPTNGIVTITNVNTGAFTYTPNLDYTGTDTFSFKTNDGTSDSNVANINLQINPVNDLPVAENMVLNVNEDTPKNFNFNVNDKDSDPVSYVIITPPGKGTLSGTAPNYIYTPNANYTGMDTITYKVNDGTADSNIATVNIVVWNSNDAPIANDNSFSVNEDSSNNNFNLTASDIENNSLTYIVLSQPTKGTLTLTNSSTGSFTYTPNVNENGLDSFTFKVNDGVNDSNIATIEININSVIDLPTANNLNIQTLKNQNKNGTVTYVNTDSLSLNFNYNQPNHGTVTLVNPMTGEFLYTPNSNYAGSDSFTYSISTPNGNSNIATVFVEVVNNNTAPVANNKIFNTNEDTLYSGNLIATDAENNTLTFSIVTPPTKGIVTITNPNNGSFTYTPNLNENGVDSFTFKVTDGSEESNIASSNITINAVNDAPVANSNNLSTTEENNVNVTLTATDVENNSLSYIVVTPPTKGTLSGTAPNLTYNPNANETGNDSFTFKANDGQLDSNTVTISINITGSNDLPISNNGNITTNEDTAFSGNLIANDADGDNLNYNIVNQGVKGVVTLNPTTGAFTYTPNLNANGSDSFTFRVYDGTGYSNTATVSVTITPVNDLPVSNNLSINVNEDTLFNGSVVATDVEGQSLTYSIISSATKGVVLLNSANGSFTYKGDQNYTGSDSFTFRVYDGTGYSNTATVSVTVNSYNTLPVANSSSFSTNEDVPYNSTLLASDADGDSYTYSIVSQGSKGTVTINNVSTGTFTYTPNLNANGSDSFTFRVYDGTGYSNTATVSVTITPVNDAPIALTDSLSTNRNTAINIVLSGTDIENSNLTYTIVSNPSNGVISGSPPFLTYTPNTNVTGNDTLTFKVNDGQLDSAIVSININVVNSNTLPIANNSPLSTNEDTIKNATLTATDADNDPLTYSIVSQGIKGTVVITNSTTGAFSYTPFANATGNDSFTFRVNDGIGNSNTATVSVTIVPVNDLPVANSQSLSTKQNTAINITLVGTDPDGDSLTYTIVGNPSKGVLSGSGSNRTYTPNLNATGSDSFTFKVNDGSSDSSTVTVSISIEDLGNWFNTAWLYRKKIHINNKNFGALANFPVMVKLNSSRIDYAKTKTAGADIRFTDSNGNLLSYEIERWNNLGESTIWVKLNSITANSTADFFYMYYGNAGANDAQNKANVWSNGYVAVYHLEEISGEPQDSTANANHGISNTGSGSMNRNVSGKIAGGEQFTTNNANFKINDSNSLDITNQLTLESWTYQTSTGSSRGVVTKKANTSQTEYGLLLNQGKPMFVLNGASVITHNTALPNNSWVYMAATFNSTTNVCKLYTSQGDLLNDNTNCTNTLAATSGEVYLGNNYSQNQSMLGAFDEIRISNVERSADWIYAQQQSMSDSYLVYASEQNQSTALNKSLLTVIDANGDDGEVTESGSYNNSGASMAGYLPMGQDKGGANWAYYRFKIPTAIANGSTVFNTRLNIFGLGQEANWLSSSMYLSVRGQKTATALAVNSNIYPGAGVTSTSAVVPWGSPGLSWLGWDWNTSPNINSIPQEIVNSYGGIGLNSYMQFWVTRGTTFSNTSQSNQEVLGEDHSNAGYNQATLLIEWN